MNKSFIYAALISSFILIAAGCTQVPFSDPLEVATDLKEMGTLLSDIQAALAIIEEDEATSRTISGTDVSGMTPEQVYTAGTPDTEGVVTSPASGFYHDLYGEDGNDWYFTLTPNGTGHYTVGLYIYPRTNFYIDYVYEEYITSKTVWEYLSDTSGTAGFVSLKNYYTDGTTGTRTLVQDRWIDGIKYAEIPIPEPVLDNLSSYTFTDLASVSQPDSTTAEVYSSETDEEIKGKNTGGFTINSTTFYTESSDQSVRTTVGYIVLDFAPKKVNDYYTVTRSKVDTAAGTTTVRSLTTDNSGYTHAQTIEKSVAAGVKSYTSTIDKYFTVPASASGTGTITDVLSLTETSAGSNNFSGTRTLYEGSTGVTYDITIDTTTSGSAKLKQNWKDVASRATGGSVEVDLDSLGDLFIQMPGVFGQFTGEYEQGSLTGTFSTNTKASEILVTESGIAVDGEFYYYSEIE